MTALNVPDLLMASQSSGLSSIRKLSGNAKSYSTRMSSFEQVRKNQGPIFEDPIWIGSPDHADSHGEMGVVHPHIW
jgi:hypothetical protein